MFRNIALLIFTLLCTGGLAWSAKSFVSNNEVMVAPVITTNLGGELYTLSTQQQSVMCPDTTDFDRKVSEVVTIWNNFLDAAKCKQSDPRRPTFPQIARDTVEAVEWYQNNETDLGGKLPNYKDMHLLVASMMAKESSMLPRVMGKRGEVGLLQVHGLAMAGMSQKIIQDNPRIGIMRGVRWLAYHFGQCPKSTPGDEWTDEDMLGPLTVYGTGPKGKQNGKCEKMNFARQRLSFMKTHMGSQI